MLRYKGPATTYTPAEIAEKLKIAGTLRAQGKRVYEIARALGITDTTYYNWLRQAGGNGRVDELRRLRRENANLRRVVKSLASLAARDTVDASQG